MQQVKYLERRDYVAAAEELGVDLEVIKAVAAVEARTSGFIKNTDLPVILFEGHHFHARTGGRYDRDFPHLSYPNWTKDHYRGKRGEYDRLLEAIQAHAGNPEPALLSTSWGMFQIMGFNFDKAGYESVTDFVNAMAGDEAAHLRAFVSFVKATGLADELRSREWAKFAQAYNGEGFRRNDYDGKLAAAFALARMRLQEERAGGVFVPERGDIVAIQTALNAALADQLPVKLVTDGWFGNNTAAAIRLYQRLNGLAETGEVDAALSAALGIASGTPSQKAA